MATSMNADEEGNWMMLKMNISNVCKIPFQRLILEKNAQGIWHGETLSDVHIAGDFNYRDSVDRVVLNLEPSKRQVAKLLAAINKGLLDPHQLPDPSPYGGIEKVYIPEEISQ